MVSIAEGNHVTDGHNSAQEILRYLQILLSKQTILLNNSAEINDVDTNALMNDYSSEQEKLIWLYATFLN